MILRRLLFVVATLFGALAPVTGASAERLLVFAAASLKGPLDRAAAAWEAAGGAEVAFAYAGSSDLARQIAAGAPADLFLSASPEWMDRIDAEGWIDSTSRRDLWGNRLVLIRHGAGPAPETLGPQSDILGALGGGRLAVALVDAVPAGVYAREALTALGLWEGVAPQLAQTADVRGALALVAIGEAPLGIVYATDAAAEPRVSVAGVFPEASHAPIRYPAALTAESMHPEAATFLEFLGGAEAKSIFAAAGFAVLGPP